MTTKPGFSAFTRGFFRKNPVPETLAGHRLRVTVGVFGVLFQLPGNFLKMTIHADWINQGHQKKYFPATDKSHRNPKNPVEAVKPVHPIKGSSMVPWLDII
jgi:hypothetical protein